MRAPVDHIAAPPFPPELPWINTAAAADGPAARAAGAGRVLGLLPRQLDPHAPVHEGLARALRRRRAARDRRPRGRVRALARPRRGARGGGAPRSPYPVVVDTELEIWELLREPRLARAVPVQPATGCCSSTTTARAATRRPSGRSRSCSGSTSRCSTPIRPEDAPGRAARAPERGRRGAVLGPYRAGGVWAVLDGQRRASRQRAHSSTVEDPGCYELISHERSTSGELALEIGARRALPRGLLHAGSSRVDAARGAGALVFDDRAEPGR